MERNLGIDLLRIVSMIMIAMLHVLGQGGVLDASTIYSAEYESAWFLEVMAFCGVNCFALISGFVGYGKRTHYANLLYLYLQVTFYTLSLTFLFQPSGTEAISWHDYIKGLFSFAMGTYWYFTVYFCMFFFTPFFNLLLEHISKKEAKIFLISVFFLFCIIPLFMREDFYNLSKGYSVVWISVLYIVGGCIRKFEFGYQKEAKTHLINFFFLIILTWISKLLIQILRGRIIGEPGEGLHFISYISPTIFLAAIELLLFFQMIKIHDGSKKIISFFAPVAFDVFLIHEHPLVVENIMQNRFVSFASYPPVALIGAVAVSSILVWLIGSLLGRIRLLIFDLLKVRKRCDLFLEFVSGIRRDK